MINKTVLHELPFYENNDIKSDINCAEYYNNYLYETYNINTLNYLIKNAKRGDLIINSLIKRNRNYNIGIIDFINDQQEEKSNNIIIKSLDDSDCYEGYPHIPIEFLDLVINNPNYYDEISMNDYELEDTCININTINFIVYNPNIFQIKNTKCLVGFLNNVLSIKDIILKLQNNITYDNKSKLFIYNWADKILIMV